MPAVITTVAVKYEPNGYVIGLKIPMCGGKLKIKNANVDLLKIYKTKTKMR